MNLGMSRPARWIAPIGVAAAVALFAAVAVLVANVGASGASQALSHRGSGQLAASGESRNGGGSGAPASNAGASSGTRAPANTGSTGASGIATLSASDLAARSHDPAFGQATAGASAQPAVRRTTITTAASRSTTTTKVPTTTVAPATTTTVAGAGGSGAGSVLFGVVTDTTTQLQAFDSDAGKKATLYGSYDSFAYDHDFDATAASSLVAQGVEPMVTWEPWDPGNGSADQPAYSLASIVAGNYDAYITRWANEINAWGHPLWLRFAHEMNGNWYPWGAGVNGNTPAQYVAAWRHVHDLFVQAGATNVTWVWTPNTVMGATPTLASLYPGDAYVDVIGVDGYNWGTTQSWGSTWQTPSQVFGATITTLEQLSSRPIMIGETASTEIGGNKADWISQFFSFLAATPRITAFVWFNLNKETDWRIESSPAARSAFAAGVANGRYS